ncbi:hypothetical protein CIW52_12570 [Mycolicibacterium sp. P9-64]|uniref:hypothetical protein n=1 Tax=Mycolicibacterium sp. P9-64 TaxID=2024612 RepID=UPI0011EDC087|nr:hypothetical protein [Mycolicibacterium sp. P9-64]KAA0083265.1 hypothetical protein CIW52_12570 [Mycolicibacterium sp. P9-64]
MSNEEVSSVEISNSIESVLRSNRDKRDHELASLIADEIAMTYVVRRKPPKPKPYQDSPRRGRVW